MDTPPTLFLVTGNRGAGKTTFCAALVEAACAAGWRVAGLLSRPVFQGSLRTEIQAEDLSTGETRVLARRSEDNPSPGTRHWRFVDDAVQWGNTVLQRSLPCDLLVVDELGPLEFELERGWLASFPAIETGQYAIAIVVVRAELLPNALMRWQEAEIVEIDTPDEATWKAEAVARAVF